MPSRLHFLSTQMKESGCCTNLDTERASKIFTDIVMQLFSAKMMMKTISACNNSSIISFDDYVDTPAVLGWI